MSWYRDPQLFLRCKGWKHMYHIYRIEKKYNVPLFSHDFKISTLVDFSRHLSLGYNQESDYDALKSWFREYGLHKYVNCQGLVIYRNYGDYPSTWSRVEEHDSIFYSLPGIINPYEIKLAEKQADEKKISAEISRLQDKVTYLQAQVSDLSAKFKYVGTWSRVEENDSIFYGLPGIINHSETKLAKKQQADEKTISQLVVETSILEEKLNNLQEQLNKEKSIRKLYEHKFFDLKSKLQEAEVTYLQEQLNQEKNDRQALGKQVLDLKTKPEEFGRGGAGGGI
ncbi:hypothetical protein MKW92_006143 [Papaver armeniacum]|nr:hypothetical protein MKW92_006143 [Papaver armeniacum]